MTFFKNMQQLEMPKVVTKFHSSQMTSSWRHGKNLSVSDLIIAACPLSHTSSLINTSLFIYGQPLQKWLIYVILT